MEPRIGKREMIMSRTNEINNMKIHAHPDLQAIKRVIGWIEKDLAN